VALALAAMLVEMMISPEREITTSSPLPLVT
jgi:hypothetical protein